MAAPSHQPQEHVPLTGLGRRPPGRMTSHRNRPRGWPLAGAFEPSPWQVPVPTSQSDRPRGGSLASAGLYIPLATATAPAGDHLAVLEELDYFTPVGTGFAFETAGFVAEIGHFKTLEYSFFLL